MDCNGSKFLLDDCFFGETGVGNLDNQEHLVATPLKVNFLQNFLL